MPGENPPGVKAGLSFFLVILAACAAQPPAAGETRFALMGDTPYSENEVGRLDRLIDDLNKEELAFVVHIGDITAGRGPCNDDWFRERKEQFAKIRHPFVLLPGDNDWTDCHRSGYSPTERLAHWRQLFCTREPRLKLEVQRGEYCEHVRWAVNGVLFVALNVQGSNNNLGRNAAMDAEHLARMKAVLAWIDDSERVFRQRKLKRIVLAMQANPFLKPRSGANGFEVLLERLKRLVADNPGAVILVNGDTHTHRDDEPLPGLRRIEPWGSPIVSWLRGTIGSDIKVGVAGLYW
jgi:hypothetical protein